MYPVMTIGIRTGNPRGFNKGRSSRFREGSRVRQTPEEGRRTYRTKRWGNNNKDEDNSPKTLNDKNQQASSQKFWQLISDGILCIPTYGFATVSRSAKTYICNIMAEGFRFMPLSLVRQRTFRLSTWVSLVQTLM